MAEYLGAALVTIAVVGAFAYALSPLFRSADPQAGSPVEEGNDHPGEGEIARLLTERDRIYRNINEIDFDREMGKLSEEDYADMIAPARSRALEVLRRLEVRGVKEGMVAVHVSETEADEIAHRFRGVLASGEGAVTPAMGESREKTLEEGLEEEIFRRRRVKDRSSRRADRAGDGIPLSESRAGSSSPSSGQTAPDRFCHACGAPVGLGHSFCSACGIRLR